MAEVTRLRRIVFEYEDGRKITCDETKDLILGKTFLEVLSTNSELTLQIMQKSSPIHRLLKKITSFFKI